MTTHDRRAYHWLILGGTGSGKTYTGRAVLRRYAKKADYLVVVNSSSQLAEFARRRVVVDIPALERDWDARTLAKQIRAAGAIHYEVSAGGDPKRISAFMDALGNACMALGKLGTNRCHVLLVIDECQNYVSQKVFSRGMRRVYSEGRKFGVDTVNLTQQLAGQGGDMLDMTVRRMVSVLIVCPMDEEAERTRVVRTWPELRDPGSLAFPDPRTGRPGEYQVRDRGSRRAGLVRVSPTGRRHFVPLTGSPAPPEGGGMKK